MFHGRPTPSRRPAPRGRGKKLVPRPVCLPAAQEGSAKSVDDGGGESASSRALQELPNSCFSTDYNKTSIHEYSAATIKTMGHLPGDGQVHRETFPVILTGSAILAVRTREVSRPLARPPKPSLRFCKENAKKTFKKCRVAPPRRRHRGFCVPWGCCGRHCGPGRRSDDRQETF